MADVKVSGLPSDSSLDGNHYVPVNDPTGPTTKRTLLSTLASFFFDQVNIPATGTGSPVLRQTDTMFDYVASGVVISADSAGVNRNASMTSGVIYINGRRIQLNAVSARTYTANKDTYVDVLDNQDGTGSLVYTEVANNAASPSLAANSVRIGIVVTGATTIAAAASINQGQEDRVLPIASSVPYCFTDSLGNIICPRDPFRRLLGYRQIVTAFTTTNTSTTQITGLSVPFIMPSTRKAIPSLWSDQFKHSAAVSVMDIWDGTVGSGTQLTRGLGSVATANGLSIICGNQPRTLSAGLHTVNAGCWGTGVGTTTFEGAPVYPGYLKIELA